MDKLTDSTGALTVAESFTAFGARRDPTNWSAACDCQDLGTIKSISREGFTGQDAIGGYSMGLNHMNGRVQDAVTGRFLSPDPRIPQPGFTQSYNRYSYVNNNPLTLIDPTGFDEKDCDEGCGGTSNDDLPEVVVVAPRSSTSTDNPPSLDPPSDVTPSITLPQIVIAAKLPSGCYSLCLEPNATTAQGQSGISYGPITLGSFNCGAKTCTYNMSTYDNPTFGQNGVSIQVNNPSDSGGAWVQTYTRTGGSPQYDVDTGASNSIYTGFGTTGAHFVDTPGIYYGTNGSFSAQTTYVVPNSSGGYTPVFTFSWSAQQSSGGVTFTTPFTVQPSSFQWSAIVTAYHP